MNLSFAGNIPDTKRPRGCEWRAVVRIGAWLLVLFLILHLFIMVQPARAQTKARQESRSLFTPQLASQIAATATYYGLDPLLVLEVMRQESAFKIGVVSPKRAAGLMQLIPATAARFGVTNPLDPQQAITGGCRYLRYLTDRYGAGNTHLILAAYNAGEGAVDKYGRKVPPYAETQNYVQSIILAYNRAIALRAHVYARVANPQLAAAGAAKTPTSQRRVVSKPDPKALNLPTIPPLGTARVRATQSGDGLP